MFLNEALPIINIINKMIQKQSPAIHFLKDGFIKKLLLRFMKSEVLQLSLTDIDLDDTGAYKPLEEVFIGQQAQTYLEDSDLSSAEIKTFYHTCQQFWLAGASYAMVNLPLNHSLLDNITWVYPFSNSYDKVDQVLAAAKLLPQVIRESEIGVLAEEYMDYCVSENHITAHDMAVDEYWHKISSLKDVSGDHRYPLLSKLAKAIIVIPHGNADVERMFSLIALNKTKLRSRLSIETLSALLCLQFNTEENCYNFKPTSKMIEKYINASASVDITS